MDTKEKEAMSNGETEERNTSTRTPEEKSKRDLGLYVRLEPSPGDVIVARVHKCPFCNTQWYNVEGNHYNLVL